MPKIVRLPETTCRECCDFKERTQTADEVAWGECWRDPPEMQPASSEDGEVEWGPVVRIVYLPYRCRSLKPREH